VQKFSNCGILPDSYAISTTVELSAAISAKRHLTCGKSSAFGGISGPSPQPSHLRFKRDAGVVLYLATIALVSDNTCIPVLGA